MKEIRCPKCRSSLTSDGNPDSPFLCGACGGTWVSARALSRACGVLTSGDLATNLRAVFGNQCAPTRYSCPGCRRGPLYLGHLRSIEVDWCPKCRGVYLDRGEAEQIKRRRSSFQAGLGTYVREAADWALSDLLYRALCVILDGLLS